MRSTLLRQRKTGLPKPSAFANPKDPASEISWAVRYGAVALSLALIVTTWPRPVGADAAFLTVGLVSLWRYGWWLVHQVRASWFLRVDFPRLRRTADQIGDLSSLRHLYLIVASYKIAPELFQRAYVALIENARATGLPTTIVAAVTSDEDRRLLNRAYMLCGCPPQIEIVVQFQRGDGKRSALETALRSVALRAPDPNSITALIDGDIILDRRAIARSLALFVADPGLAAATTNNGAMVQGSHAARAWYTLRHAQRHVLMSSMAVSRRLLVLTGRFSMFRSVHTTDPAFIERVGHDAIHHWRHGRFKFVSGDDKSTWYQLMLTRAKMLYIPDVMAYGVEELPADMSFLGGTTALTRRWFGNMLRTSSRAIALGPRRCGLFVWWTLVDQRLSIWTSLIGPSTALLLGALVSPMYVFYYLAWAMVTRSVMSVAVAAGSREFSFSWPFLMYYNQVWGAVMKSYLLFRLNHQGWTRQRIGHSRAYSGFEGVVSAALHVAAVTLLFLTAGVMSGLVDLSALTAMPLFAAR